MSSNFTSPFSNKKEKGCLFLIKKIVCCLKTAKDIFFLMYNAAPIRLIKLLLYESLAGLSIPITLHCSQQFIDSVASAIMLHSNPEKCILWLSALSVVGVANSISTLLVQFEKEAFGEDLNRYVVIQVVDKCDRLCATQFDKASTYDQVCIAMKETPDRCTLLADLVGSTLKSLVTIMSLVIIVCSFNWIFLVVLFLSSLPLIKINRKTSKRWYETYISQAPSNRLLDVLKSLLLSNACIAELKIFESIKQIKENITTLMCKQSSENKKSRRKAVYSNLWMSDINAAVTFALKCWVLVSSIAGGGSIGEINKLLLSVDNLQTSLRGIVIQTTSMQEQVLYIQTMFDVLSFPEDSVVADDGIDEAIQSIDFDNVSFLYPNTQEPVLKDVTIHFKANHIYGLMGSNGSGKSTLLKLLMGIYTPTQGRILINGKDITQWDTRRLRSQISAVFQDYIHYPYSIKENIAIGKPNQEIPMEKIKSAAKYSMADAFIAKTPMNYETPLGKEWENGIELSTGQWQRIAVSRCIYKDSSVRILDEPFASLDAQSTDHILKQLQKDKPGKITVLVTHQYKNLSDTDTIILLDYGKVIASGTHGNLKKENSFYRRFISTQGISL